MSTIPDFLQGVVTGLAGMAPAAKSVEVHRGRFKLADVSGATFATPALRLGLMGVRRVMPVASGERDVTLRLSCAIVTVDRRGEPREAVANAMVNDLVIGIFETTWSLPNAHPATDVAGDNLFTGDVGRMGIMLWEVTWSQAVRLGENAFAADGQLKSINLGMASQIGADHEDKYEEVGNAG